MPAEPQPEPTVAAVSVQSEVFSPQKIEVMPRGSRGFTDITLPQPPEVPVVRTSADHLHESMADYHHGRGWWWSNMRQESRTKFAGLLADQAQHLYRLQTIANATEAEAYLREYKLWSLEVEAVLEAEEAQTGIAQRRFTRASLDISHKLNLAASNEGSCPF